MKRILKPRGIKAIIKRGIRIKEGLYNLICLLAKTIVVKATAKALLHLY